MEYIIFGNEQTKVYFGEEKGYLEKIEYKGRTIDLHSKLWSVQTKEGELGIADMTEFRHECYDGVIKLFWANDIAKVGITVKNGEDGKLRWRINADVFGGEVVRRVKFPILEGLNFDTENYLLITWQNGHLVKNPVDTFLCKGLEVPFWVGYGTGAYKNEYPAALSFQYGAFYGQDYGYYFVTEDPDAYIKTFEYEYNKEKHAMDLTIVNYPENMGKTTSYCMAYDFVLKLFEGDWQTATNYYRDWAIRQKWCKKKLSEKKLPEKLVKTDLWRINHHDYEMGTRTQEYFDTALKIRDAVDCNLALHWYGWNMSAHDKDYPEYISDEMKAKGWMEELTNWNKKFDDEGIVKIPYHNARLWEIKTKTWDGMNVAASAIKDETGNFPDEPWMPEMGYELKAVCPATALWQNRVADLCREYGTEVGFDGVYLDQVASFNATLCFDETHPHPAGGGTWWNDTYHSMLGHVRDIVGDERIVTTESCCETYIDVFDLFLVLDTCFQYAALNGLADAGSSVSVPLFNLIYSDYALAYGSVCEFSHRPDQFEFNFMRNLLWGLLPCIEGGSAEELESGAEYLEITKRGVDFYKKYKEIFLYGRLCEVPQYTCDATCSVDWVARNEQREQFPYTDTFPAICAVIWETAQGEKYLFAYNYGDSVQSMEMNGKTYEVSAKSFYSKML
ncbi:MAG: hypothetical protein E7409_04995 [Ruminococcaceae bacterium]|nr:hypothetical protein [Oscillospiraceae bacterium]